MKRFISAIVCLGLAAAGTVYMSSCAAQKGPLSPNTNLLNPASSSTGLPQVSSISWTSGAAIGVSQTVRVQFNLAMNPASFSTSTVKVYTQDTYGVGEATYSNYTVSYNATLRTLFIAPSPDFWADNTWYRVVLTTGITSIAGAQLDGNKNQRAEDQAFDNFMATFATGSAPVGTGYGNIYNSVSGGGPLGPLAISSLVLNYYTVGAGGTTSTSGAVTVTGNIAGIAAALPVTITATFSQRLDVNTAWASDTSLAPAFVFTDSNGTPVAPTSVTLTSGNTAIQAEFMNGLPASTKFQLIIKGGLNGLRSADEDNLILMRHLYFDGNGPNKYPNGIAEAADDSMPL